MDNIAFLDNPYREGVSVPTRGVAFDAKAAKLNNTAKKPYVKKKWRDNRPNNLHLAEPNTRLEVKEETNDIDKDYSSLSNRLNISTVNHAEETNISGARKIRVNKIVCEKTSKFNKTSKKTSLTPQEEVVNLINQINVTPTPAEIKEEVKEEVHGKHEKTGEVPVADIREAIRQELTGAIPIVSSRTEKNALTHEVENKGEIPKEEPKAFDWDLYNNKVHGDKVVGDVSRQLQGARKELTLEKEESRKLAEEYDKAVRERDELKRDVENKKRLKAQQEEKELAETLNNINTLKEENLAKTNDLSSIQAELAQLRAEKQALESVKYDNRNEYENHDGYSRGGSLAA